MLGKKLGLAMNGIMLHTKPKLMHYVRLGKNN